MVAAAVEGGAENGALGELDRSADGRMSWFASHKVRRAEIVRWCAWFAFGTGALFALVALRYLTVAPIASSWSARGFTVLMFAAQTTLVALGFFVLIAPLALALPRPRIVASFAIALASLGLTLTLVDTFVYQQYRFHLDASVWNLITGGAAEETFVFSTRSYLKLAALILTFFAALIGLAWSTSRWASSPIASRAGRVLAVVLTVVVLAHSGVCVWANAAAYVPITRQARVLPLYKQVSAKGMLKRLGIRVARADIVRDDPLSGLLYPRAPLDFAPPTTRPNVLFLVIDSWRADALNSRATPRLAEFAQQSQRFAEHMSCGNATRIGMFSLFYGLPGTYWHDVLGERRPSVLVSEFARAGYEVQTFRSAPLYSPEFDCTIFGEIEGLRLESDGATPAERDRDATEDFVAWLGARDAEQPFFSLLFWDAPHAYDFPPDRPLEFQPSLDVVDYLALGPNTDPEPFKNRYLNSVRYVDELAGRALDALRASGALESTIVIVTGDHGQEFNDLAQNYWGHNSNFAPPQVHVPMFIHWPGRAPRSFEHLTSHFDVVPTLLGEVLGCTNSPEDFSLGRSMFDSTPRGVLTMATYGDFAAVTPRERYVVVRSAGDIEVFDARYELSELTELDREALRTTLHHRTLFRPTSNAQKR